MSNLKDSIYFACYGSLAIHKAMLRDEERMEFYHSAIMNNVALFKDKTVLDVGCGLGVLSLFAAKAGAKKVYAVEASSEILALAQFSFVRNGLDHIIEAVEGVIEDITLDDNIDIIVSEWMGYCLFYEMMLPSVLFARDKYSPKVMIPNEGSLFIAGFNDKSYHHKRLDWTQDEVLGLNLSSLSKDICSQIWNEKCASANIATTSYEVFNGDLYSLAQDKCCTVKEIDFELRLKRLDKPTLHGILIYFEAHFSQGRTGRLTLTTSPNGLPTHWQQSLCLFETPMMFEGNSLKGTFQLKPLKDAQPSKGRGIEILFKIKDSQYRYILP